jgi:hypothetical protein
MKRACQGLWHPPRSATKALASKICKACYFIIKEQEDFDLKKMFG